MNNTLVYFFFGTTAEYIKILPVIRLLKAKKIPYRLILSGQTTIPFKEFTKIVGDQKPYHSFESKQKKSSSSGFAIWTLKTFMKGLLWGRKEFTDKSNHNAIFVVQGDTVSALIGSIIAKTNGIKLAHIEAGLRTHNLLEPFPEEICRILISYFSNYHFCPNSSAIKNIKSLSGRKVNTFFNTSMESISLALKSIKKVKLPTAKKYFIFIVHRQEHLFLRKGQTKDLINGVFMNMNKNIDCVFVIHDVTKAYLQSTGMWKQIEKMPNVHLVPRMPYIDFTNMLGKSEYIITDGGGNHTEAYYLGKPCLIFKKQAEQREGVGENIVLSGEDAHVIKNFMNNYRTYKRKQIQIKKWPSEIIFNTLFS